MVEPILIQQLLFILALSQSENYDAADLAAKIKNGNHAAFKSFFEAHHRSLFRFLMSKGIAKETAEDLVQKAFIYIWEHRQKIDPQKSLRAYLFRMGYTRMLNHIRDNKKFDTAKELSALKSGKNPDDEVRRKELQESINKAIDAMPKKRGLVFKMCFIQDFTYRETAATLDVSIKTVENHMGLAFKDIRSALSHFVSDK